MLIDRRSTLLQDIGNSDRSGKSQGRNEREAMAHLHTKTKKVTTYGRSKTRVISLYSDWVPETVTNIPSDQKASPSKETTPIVAAPIKRAPLQSKASQNDCRVLADVLETPAKGGKTKEKKMLTVEIPVTKPMRAAVRPRKAKAVQSVLRSARDDTPISTTLPSAGLRGEYMKRQQAALAPKLAPEDDMNTLEEHISQLSVAEHAVDPLEQLLRACSQTVAYPFDDLFTDSAQLTTLLTTASSRHSGPPPPATIKGIRGRVLRPQSIGSLQIRKIGEASFSEVYGVSSKDTVELVMKVIPLLPVKELRKGESAVDEPDASELEDVFKEVQITKVMSEVDEGFVRFHAAFVVQGAYPEVLLDCWDDYKWAKSTSGYRPSTLPANQRYAVMVLANEGVDLESFKFDSAVGWTQALAVFKQTAAALAKAEKEAEFEHRDLHAGQIMVSFEPTAGTVKATIIDFGLSRVRENGQKAIWSAPPADVYEGVGAQWDVYRAMRDCVGDKWDTFHPSTNVLWLQHILDVLLHSTKSLRKPRTSPKPTLTGPSSPIRTRRVGSAATVKRAIGPALTEVIAWQRLIACETALIAGRMETARAVADAINN